MRANDDPVDDEAIDAEWIAAFGPPSEPSLITGTALDEFTPVYRSLARVTPRHGSFGESEIDGWDITTVAVVMGIDAGDVATSRLFDSWKDEYEAWKAEQVTDQSES